jgi:hypothetical protein
MTDDQIAELVERYEDNELMLMDGYNDCILGVCTQFNKQPVFAYSMKRIIQKHVDNGMTIEEAIEFFEFNQAGAYVGEGTPVFIDDDLSDLETEETVN